jgi:diguanylate cyclase (GGDEF)-like protein
MCARAKSHLAAFPDYARSVTVPEREQVPSSSLRSLDMSHREHPSGSGDGRLVLLVVGEFAALMLAAADPEQVDEDVSGALIGGLRVLVPSAEVLRARFAFNSDGDVELQETHEVSRLKALGETEKTMFQAVSATRPVSRQRAGGEVVSLMAPLVLRAGAIDLFVLRTTGGALSDTDALAFATLRDLASAAIVGRQARDEARLDALTGCLNHGAMHAQLAKEVARAERVGGPLACVMLDLDDFKSVNERHGHPVGDELLRAVSASLREQCRPYDSCCRYGGDEFLMILPASDIDEATAAAARMRSALARAAIRYDSDEIAVTATTGVAAWRPGESAADLITRADQALFSGKDAKRDDDRNA